jgi:hypothetical protein
VLGKSRALRVVPFPRLARLFVLENFGKFGPRDQYVKASLEGLGVFLNCVPQHPIFQIKRSNMAILERLI